jgi:hypothetical protein
MAMRAEIAYVSNQISIGCNLCDYTTPHTTAKNLKLMLKLHYKKTHNSTMTFDCSVLNPPPRTTGKLSNEAFNKKEFVKFEHPKSSVKKLE